MITLHDYPFDKRNKAFDEKEYRKTRIKRFEKEKGYLLLPDRVLDTGFKTEQGESLFLGYYEEVGILTDLGQVNRVFNNNGFVLEYDLIDSYKYTGVYQLYPFDDFSDEEDRYHRAKWNSFLDANTGFSWKPDMRRYELLVSTTHPESLPAECRELGLLMQRVIDAMRNFKNKGDTSALRRVGNRYKDDSFGLGPEFYVGMVKKKHPNLSDEKVAEIAEKQWNDMFLLIEENRANQAAETAKKMAESEEKKAENPRLGRL